MLPGEFAKKVLHRVWHGQSLDPIFLEHFLDNRANVGRRRAIVFCTVLYLFRTRAKQAKKGIAFLAWQFGGDHHTDKIGAAPAAIHAGMQGLGRHRIEEVARPACADRNQMKLVFGQKGVWRKCAASSSPKSQCQRRMRCKRCADGGPAELLVLAIDMTPGSFAVAGQVTPCTVHRPVRHGSREFANAPGIAHCPAKSVNHAASRGSWMSRE